MQNHEAHFLTPVLLAPVDAAYSLEVAVFVLALALHRGMLVDGRRLASISTDH